MAKYNEIKINRICPTLFLSVLLLFTLPSKAKAQVVINGYLFQGQELALLESYLGSIPPGRYWLDVNTGNWGYEGNSQIQGNILIQQNSSATDNSQDNIRSYGSNGGAAEWGHYANDGECSYVSIPGLSYNSCDPNW